MSRSEINRFSEILRCKTQKLEKRQARRGASAKLSECKLFSNFQSPKPVWRRLPRPGAIFRLQRDNEKENRGWRILLKIKQKSFFVHFQWKYCGEFRILPQLRCEIGILLVFARIENNNNVFTSPFIITSPLLTTIFPAILLWWHNLMVHLLFRRRGWTWDTCSPVAAA